MPDMPAVQSGSAGDNQSSLRAAAECRTGQRAVTAIAGDELKSSVH